MVPQQRLPLMSRALFTKSVLTSFLRQKLSWQKITQSRQKRLKRKGR
jgi:hypothetical protein